MCTLKSKKENIILDGCTCHDTESFLENSMKGFKNHMKLT